MYKKSRNDLYDSDPLAHEKNSKNVGNTIACAKWDIKGKCNYQCTDDSMIHVPLYAPFPYVNPTFVADIVNRMFAEYWPKCNAQTRARIHAIMRIHANAYASQLRRTLTEQ